MNIHHRDPFAKLRDVEWLRTMGHTPSIMDYSRFHYVAQPEDKIPAELLIPRVGPYDKFAIKWGYTPVAGAKSPEQEKSALHEIVKVQDTTPWLRFSTARSMGSDPGELTEAVGDEDAIEATNLGALARLAAIRGDDEEAERLDRRSAELAHMLRWTWWESTLRCYLLLHALRRGNLDVAEREGRHALRISE